MRTSLVLGILGCIFGFLGAILAATIGAIGQAFSVAGASSVYAVGAVTIIGSVIGLVGGVIGSKKGGILLIVGAILALVGTSLYCSLAFILLLVGGVLAFFGEKPGQVVVVTSVTSSVPQAQAPSVALGPGRMFCERCGTKLSEDALFCGGLVIVVGKLQT